MRRLFLISIGVLYGFVATKAQLVVSDPASVAQRLLLSAEEMEEMVEQKYKFIEQIEVLKKTYEQARETKERLEKVTNAIKQSQEAIAVIEKGSEIFSYVRVLKNDVADNPYLTDEQKFKCINRVVDCAGEATEITKAATKVLTNRSGSNDQNLSDYERMQRLRQLNADLERLKCHLRFIVANYANHINTCEKRNFMNRMNRR